MSPALATGKPLWSFVDLPSIRKPDKPSRVESDGGAKRSRLAEHHIQSTFEMCVFGADEEIGEAVAVDVAGTGDGDTDLVGRRHTVDLEAVGTTRADNWIVEANPPALPNTT